MKKLLLLFTAIIFGLSLTSCLDGGSQSFSDPVQFVYIDQGSIYTYGKTFHGRGLIYSDAMMLRMDYGSFYAFSFAWNEESGYTDIDGVNAHNVSITSDEMEIPKTHLNPSPAPAEDTGSKFKEIFVQLQDVTGGYINDLWLLPYSYSGKEGETTNVTFYLRNQETGEEADDSDTVEIDVRLTVAGEGTGDEKEIIDYVSVDMKYLRDTYIISDNDEISIKLYYYEDGKDEPVLLLNQDNQPFKMSKPAN